jgi:hypothetical protein
MKILMSNGLRKMRFSEVNWMFFWCRRGVGGEQEEVHQGCCRGQDGFVDFNRRSNAVRRAVETQFALWLNAMCGTAS